MYLPLTFGLLGLLTAAVIVLRFRWWNIPSWIRRTILIVAFAAVFLRVAFLATQWSMVFPRMNAMHAWVSVTGYEILLARFSLMRPRWLTSIGALILLMPLIGSTLVMPLTRFFDWSKADISSLGGPYIVEKSPWDTDASGNSGMDLVVFYRPQFFPFVRHMVQRAAFGNDECRSEAATVKADLETRSVHFHCPAKESGKAPIDLVLPLR
ncbi:hypothetical protein [Edaphobacter albus]|uniref:hypothetical protein n=1 Tax=Edaphobacter sp. 4G125 TaxID=2763071 RepID=UPI0016492BE8|nr:hypothetical protein [Edaphobacter sp. 4G125]QNI35738.1 hypothetical protein H7846_11885 [Edaphobacter sp. 4G125]